MPEWLVGQAEQVGVIGKALLMYGTAVVRETGAADDGALVHAGLANAAGFVPR
jgi:hypothetical protein